MSEVLCFSIISTYLFAGRVEHQNPIPSAGKTSPPEITYATPRQRTLFFKVDFVPLRVLLFPILAHIMLGLLLLCKERARFPPFFDSIHLENADMWLGSFWRARDFSGVQRLVAFRGGLLREDPRNHILGWQEEWSLGSDGKGSFEWVPLWRGLENRQ